jgi:hypothetical protein
LLRVRLADRGAAHGWPGQVDVRGRPGSWNIATVRQFPFLRLRGSPGKSSDYFGQQEHFMHPDVAKPCSAALRRTWEHGSGNWLQLHLLHRLHIRKDKDPAISMTVGDYLNSSGRVDAGMRAA